MGHDVGERAHALPNRGLRLNLWHWGGERQRKRERQCNETQKYPFKKTRTSPMTLLKFLGTLDKNPDWSGMKGNPGKRDNT